MPFFFFIFKKTQPIVIIGTYSFNYEIKIFDKDKERLSCLKTIVFLKL